MVELVEAGMQGLLGEELLSAVLQVNDDLHKTVNRPISPNAHGLRLTLPPLSSLLTAVGSRKNRDADSPLAIIQASRLG